MYITPGEELRIDWKIIDAEGKQFMFVFYHTTCLRLMEAVGVTMEEASDLDDLMRRIEFAAALHYPDTDERVAMLGLYVDRVTAGWSWGSCVQRISIVSSLGWPLQSAWRYSSS